MQFFKTTLAVAAALAALLSCSKEEGQEENQEQGQDDQTVTVDKTSSVTSDSELFTASDGGGTILFPSSGGQVTLNVECWDSWTVVEDGADWLYLGVSPSAGILSVTAAQTTLETEQTATLTLQTVEDGTRFAVIEVVQSAYGRPEISVGETSWHAPAVGALTTVITVEANTDWSVADVSETWLSAVRGDGGLTLTAAENDSYEERNATVTLTCSDGVTSADELTISVLQDARAAVTASVDALTFNRFGNTLSFTVESNYDWTVSAADSWAEVSAADNTVAVTVSEYGDEDSRSTTVTVTAGDGAENVAETHVTVTQTGLDPSAMILEITTSYNGQTIMLPLTATVDCTVNWGDGTEVESRTDSLPTHTYETQGVYNVSISGTVTRLSCQSLTYTGDNERITGVVQWGKTGLQNMYMGLYGTRVTTVPADTDGSFSEVYGMTELFAHSSLKEIPADLFKYASKVTTLNRCFDSCTGLTEIPEGLFSQTSYNSHLEYAFNGCTGIKEIPEKIFEGCSSLTDVLACFSGCTGLTSLPENVFSYTPALTNVNSFISGCTGITSIPPGLFKNAPSTLAKVGAFFSGCTGLTSIPSGLFDGCSGVTAANSLFNGCTGLSEIPAGLFDGLTGVTTLEYVFQACTGITTIPPGLLDNCTSLTSVSNLFYGCKGLKSIPEGLFDKCTAATTAIYAFYNCSGLTDIPDGLFDNLTNLTNMSYIFYGCSGLKEIPKGLFDKNTACTAFTGTFSGCTGLTEIPEGLFANNPAVQYFNTTFQKCTGLTSLPDNLFANNPAVLQFSGTFNGCTGLTAIPTGLFDACTKVTVFKQCFYNCSKLSGESPYTLDSDGSKIHLYQRTSSNGFATISSSNRTNCFYGCTGLSDYSAIASAGWN